MTKDSRLDSESILKSFNGSLKKIHSESSCFEIFLFPKLFRQTIIYDLLIMGRFHGQGLN